MNTNLAEKQLRGTLFSKKNDILFSEFQTNYNNERIIYRKGTTSLRKRIRVLGHKELHQVIFPLHEDMIHHDFWKEHDEILSQKSNVSYKPCEEILPELVSSQMNSKHREVEIKMPEEEMNELSELQISDNGEYGLVIKDVK